MTYKFLTRPLEDGAYEPEGIYLSSPLEGDCIAVQFWGDNSEHYQRFTYNGIPLKGHTGIDFLVTPGTLALAVDVGRVTEIGDEQGGIGRYIKIEHRWGESFYAHIDTILLDSGQQVARGAQIAVVGDVEMQASLHRQQQQRDHPHYLHFGIRIKPFNRFDGWGGFVDPLPYLNPSRLLFATDSTLDNLSSFPPHPMLREQGSIRRA